MAVLCFAEKEPLLETVDVTEMAKLRDEGGLQDRYLQVPKVIPNWVLIGRCRNLAPNAKRLY